MIHVINIVYELPAKESVYFFRLPSNIKFVKKIGVVPRNPFVLMNSLATNNIDNPIKYSIILNERDYVIIEQPVNTLGLLDSTSFTKEKFDYFNYSNVMKNVNTKILLNSSHRLVLKEIDNLPAIPILFGIGILVPLQIFVEYGD